MDTTKKATFSLEPKAVPSRKKTGKYADTLDTFLASKVESSIVHLEGTKINAAYSGFHRAIKNGYTDKVTLSRVDGEIYIEKL